MFKSVIVAALLLLVSGAFSSMNTDAAAIGSTSLWETTTKSIRTPARYYDVLQERFEIDPHQWTSLRNSQATFILTVIEGELTLVQGETKLIYRQGQTGIALPGINFRFGNQTGAVTKVQETILVPAWQIGPGTILEPATAPVRVTTPVARGPFSAIAGSPPTVDITQQGGELRPGFVSSPVVANAFNVISVSGGELTLRFSDGTSQRLTANQVANLPLGKSVVIANEGSTAASYFISWLAASGTDFLATQPAQPITTTSIRPPSTGDGGLAVN